MDILAELGKIALNGIFNSGSDTGSPDMDTGSTDDTSSSEEGSLPTFTGYGRCKRFLCNCQRRQSFNEGNFFLSF